MLLGVLGGSFDPIHFGHLRAAEEVREYFGLQKILFVPSPYPPHKHPGKLSELFHRRRMIELAIASNPCFELSLIEESEDRPSFSIETIRKLKKRYGSNCNIHFIVGSDSALEMLSWRDPLSILEESKVVIVPRPGFDASAADKRVLESAELLDTTPLGISSTEIRKRVAAGGSIMYLTPTSVVEYIDNSRLYKSS